MLSRLCIGSLLATEVLLAQGPLIPQFVPVPAGEFSMGSADGAAWEKPSHSIEVPAFEISAKPVSNQEFQAYRPSHRSPGEETPDAPVTGITWNDAMAYAEWLQEQLGVGVVLPSEARWERAVRGGLEKQTYPWGNEFGPTAEAESGTKTAPRANAYGVYAVTYNLWEWTSDWYAPDYYRSSPTDDPTGPKTGDFRVLRGGGFRSDPTSATCYSRGSARPATSSAYVTFRVMKTGRAPVTQITEALKTAPPPAHPTDTAAPKAPVVSPTGSLNVTALNFESVGSGLAIQLSTTAQASYRAFALTGPDRLVLDVNGAVQTITKGSGNVAVGAGGVDRIRYSQFQMDPAVTRVVIDLAGPVDHRVSASASQLVVQLTPKN